MTCTVLDRQELKLSLSLGHYKEKRLLKSHLHIVYHDASEKKGEGQSLRKYIFSY